MTVIPDLICINSEGQESGLLVNTQSKASGRFESQTTFLSRPTSLLINASKLLSAPGSEIFHNSSVSFIVEREIYVNFFGEIHFNDAQSLLLLSVE